MIRLTETGPIVLSFASYPIRSNTPPDGIRAAVIRAAGRVPCSAATFFWSERQAAEGWLQGQIDARRRNGIPVRLIVAGHGLGATEAAEATRDILNQVPDAQVVLLLTVDAVRPGRIASAAGAASAMVNRLPGVNTSLNAYDSAPVPDGRRFLTHINYYQDVSQHYHGVAMPGAENHRLDDWTGLLNHGNADDFALPLLTADLYAALRRGSL